MEEEVVLGCDEGDVPELGVEVLENTDRLWRWRHGRR